MTQSLKLTSPKVVQEILQSQGLRPRKRFGQNFLCDENIVTKIINAAELTPSESVLEIGGGLGTLTQQIAGSSQDVAVIEIDSDLVPILKNNLAGFPNVRVIHDDALKLNWKSLFPDKKRFKCLGNLPYNITAPLLEKLIETRSRIEFAIWMLQIEVAQKITAPVGTRETSSLGIFVQSFCDVKILFRVSQNAFFPKPEVGSAVLRISPLTQPRFHASDESFQRIVRSSFGMRRKTLYRALCMAPQLNLTPEQVRSMLSNACIEESRRGETLSIDEFDRIAQQLDFLA
ncbi:ribosomal RNA small subunit methyltransferase A [Candidatus Acetothermia bacterium]|nr:ribosomal RNA small subunit methyltransferase A [Candidatus Acetothermia bacterium]MBI3643206.1 ribosomal RNA small subunit methyltransferase A [Candidatus Acetothermia bacterium]